MKQIFTGIPNILTFIIIGVVLIGGLYVSGLPQTPFGAPVILSLSKVTIGGQEGFLSSFVIASGAGGDRYTIAPTASELNTNWLQDLGLQASNAYTLNAKITKSICSYPLNPSAESVYTVVRNEWSGSTGAGSFLGKSASEQYLVAQTQCRQEAAVKYINELGNKEWTSSAYRDTVQETGVGEGRFTCFVIYKIKKADGYLISSTPVYSWEAQFDLTHPSAGTVSKNTSGNIGESKDITFDFSSGKTAVIKNINAGLATGVQCAGSGTKIVSKDVGGTSWGLKSNYVSTTADIVGIFATANSAAGANRATYDSQVAKVQTTYTASYLNNPTIKTGTLSSSSFSYNTLASEAVINPAFQLWTNSEFLGITKLKSNPVISNVVMQLTGQTSGSQAKLSFAITNIGSEGDVKVYYNCPSTTISGQYTENNMANGDVAEREISGTVLTTVDTTGKCTVTVTDATDSSITRNAESATYTVKKAVQCWGSGVYNPSTGKCTCPLTEVVGKTLVKDDLGCRYEDAACVAPTLKQNEEWQAYPICAVKCKTGYVRDILQNCVVGACTNTCPAGQTRNSDCSCSGGNTNTTVSCQATVDALPACGLGDFGCEIGKAFKRADCTILPIADALKISTAIVCAGGVLIAVIVGATVVMSRNKKGGRK